MHRALNDQQITSIGTPGLARNSSMGATLAATVSVKDISKEFRLAENAVVVALRNISLDIRPGEFVAVVGPSGCGKSTLLRLLAGLEDPTAGSILIDGSLPKILARDHQLGVAFQDHALLPWLTVAENVSVPFRLSGQRADMERVHYLLELVGLDDFANARPRQLSGGMKQRVSIARSIAMEPRLLLMDEPFGALDLVTRRILNLEMQKLWAEIGTTILLITHSVEEAVLLADRVIVLTSRPGRLASAVDVRFSRPRDRDVTATTTFRDIVDEVSGTLDIVSGAPGSGEDGGAR